MDSPDDELALQELAKSEWKPELEWEREPELPPWARLLRSLSLRGQMLPGLAFVFVVNLLLPPTLTWLFLEGRLGAPAKDPQSIAAAAEAAPPAAPWDLGRLLEHILHAGLPAAGGAVVLAMILMSWLRTYPKETPYREYPHVFTGAHAGALYSFLNLPLCLSFQPLFREDGFWPVRLFVLTIWMGLLCGGWVGWMAYREHHTERGWFPPLTFKTFVGFTGGAVLLGVLFAPGFFKVRMPESGPPHEPAAKYRRA